MARLYGTFLARGLPLACPGPQTASIIRPAGNSSWLCVLVWIAVAFASGCGGGSGSSGDPSTLATLSTISVVPQSASVSVGSSQQFQATAKDQNGNVMSGINFLF